MPFTYTLKHETIEFAGGNITVRGLGVPEFTQLVSVHTDAAVTLFAEIQAKAAKNEALDIAELLFDVLNRFQAAVSHIIALAADEPGRVSEVAKLPVDVQMAAIEKIAGLTFAMDGGAKKFWETAKNIALANAGLKENGSQLLQTFMNGSGLSEPK